MPDISLITSGGTSTFGSGGFLSSRLATRFLSSLELSLPVYRMSSEDMVTLGISGLPTNILLDLEGRVVVSYAGYSPTVPAEIRRRVAAMGGEPETTEQSSDS